MSELKRAALDLALALMRRQGFNPYDTAGQLQWVKTVA
jgi:hypothetical protein